MGMYISPKNQKTKTKKPLKLLETMQNSQNFQKLPSMLTVIGKQDGATPAYDGSTPGNPRRVDKNNNPYVYVTVRTANRIKQEDPETGGIIFARVNARESSFNAYHESYLLDAQGKGLSQFGHDFEIGDKVMGDIVTREIEPFFIPSALGNGKHELDGVNGNWVETGSAIVFGDNTKDDWELKVINAFRTSRNGMKLKGVVMDPRPLEITTTDTRQSKPAAFAGSDDEIVTDDKPQAKVINEDAKKAAAEQLDKQPDPATVGDSNPSPRGNKTNSAQGKSGNFGGTSKTNA